MSHLLLATAKAKTRQKRQRRITADYIQQHIKILDKQQELVPFRMNRVQQHLAQHLTGRDIVLKSRQQGVSTLVRVMHESKAMAQRTSSATLAHDQTTTDMLRLMSETIWDNLPDNIKPERITDNATTTIYDNTHSRVVIKTAGSTKGGRGGTYSDIHGSEVAYWANPVATMSGIMQGIPVGFGNIILESTPNGASGWFYETCMEALDKADIWTLHFYEWWWADEYQLPLELDETIDYTPEESELVRLHQLTPEQIKWRRYKIKELPHTFKQEYPEDVYSCFLTSGNSFFGDIEHVFSATPIDPSANISTVAGLDFGQSDDYTVMVVIDPQTRQQVDKIRINRMLWETMRGRIRMMCQKWNVKLLIPELNSIGSVNIEELRKELADLNVIIRPFNTTPRSKPALVQALYAGLHEQGLRLQNDNELKHELRNFVSVQSAHSGNWKYEGANGAHDDCVIALALAWLAVMRGSISIEAI